MRRLVGDNDGPYVDRPIHALPAGHTWQHSPSVTLLGDAAHLMPPLGVGVNLALLDACELALALARHDTVGEAVRAYEDTMLPAPPRPPDSSTAPCTTWSPRSFPTSPPPPRAGERLRDGDGG